MKKKRCQRMLPSNVSVTDFGQMNSNMTNNSKPKLLVMAGGTGGHIFPGLAVADELTKQGWDIHWLGTADRMEASIVPKQGYEISFIKMTGIRHKGLITRLATPLMLLKAMWQAHNIIKQVKPDVVIGMGGYASAPGGIAAWYNRIPLIVHEQNAAAGLTNRVLSKFTNKTCCAFPNAFSPSIDVDVVGNPLRSSIGQAQQANKIDQTMTEEVTDDTRVESRHNILVVGGSLGAQVLNEIAPQSLKNLRENHTNLSVWHQTGKGNCKQVTRSYEGFAELSSVKVEEFIIDMASAYEWADLVICRAGALTVSELAMAATPAIFVPLPHAVDDHQTKNAQYLVNKGGARLLPQNELTKESLTSLINELFIDDETLLKMSAAALDASDDKATTKVANLCQQLLLKT